MRAYILAREDAIRHWREVMGPTKVFRARYTSPASIRGQFGLTDTRNTTHGSGREVCRVWSIYMWRGTKNKKVVTREYKTASCRQLHDVSTVSVYNCHIFNLYPHQILLSRHKEKSVSSSRTSAWRSGWRRKSPRSDQDKYVTTMKNWFTRFQRKADPRAAVTVNYLGPQFRNDPRNDDPRKVHVACSYDFVVTVCQHGSLKCQQIARAFPRMWSNFKLGPPLFLFNLLSLENTNN